MNLLDHARLRMMALAGSAPRRTDRVAFADFQTTMADARTAVCLARGVPQRHIDPATGLDLSPRSYRAARASWVAHVQGGHPHAMALVADALDGWLARAPHIVAAVEEVDPLTSRFPPTRTPSLETT